MFYRLFVSTGVKQVSHIVTGWYVISRFPFHYCRPYNAFFFFFKWRLDCFSYSFPENQSFRILLIGYIGVVLFHKFRCPLNFLETDG